MNRKALAVSAAWVMFALGMYIWDGADRANDEGRLLMLILGPLAFGWACLGLYLWAWRPQARL